MVKTSADGLQWAGNVSVGSVHAAMAAAGSVSVGVLGEETDCLEAHRGAARARNAPIAGQFFDLVIDCRGNIPKRPGATVSPDPKRGGGDVADPAHARPKGGGRQVLQLDCCPNRFNKLKPDGTPQDDRQKVYELLVDIVGYFRGHNALIHCAKGGGGGCGIRGGSRKSSRAPAR